MERFEKTSRMLRELDTNQYAPLLGNLSACVPAPMRSCSYSCATAERIWRDGLSTNGLRTKAQRSAIDGLLMAQHSSFTGDLFSPPQRRSRLTVIVMRGNSARRLFAELRLYVSGRRPCVFGSATPDSTWRELIVDLYTPRVIYLGSNLFGFHC